MGFGIGDGFRGFTAQPPGSQMAASGPYRDEIARLTSNYPILKYGEDFQTDSSRFHSRSRAALYDFSNAGLLPEPSIVECSMELPHQTQQPHIQKLRALLHSDDNDPNLGCRKELLVVEGLQPDFVAEIGHAWKVDPRTFSYHQHNGLWNMEQEGATRFLLPSSMAPKLKFNLQYQEIRYFDGELPSDILRAADNYRNIGTTSIGRKRDQAGIVSRKVSYWARNRPKGGWQVLLLVDAPVSDVFVGKVKHGRIQKLDNEPFQGGYPDFASYDEDPMQACRAEGPPRSCMFEDIRHYLKHHHHLLDYAEPSCTTYFPKLIIASHYHQVYHYTRGLFDQLEYLLDRRHNFAVQNPEATLQPFWSDLHHFRRRLENYTRQLACATIQLGIDEIQKGAHDIDNLADKNILYLLREFKDLDQRSDTIFTAYGVLSDIASSQQGFLEFKAAQSLQYLAVVFLPLSFAASLFSMSDAYNAGQHLFWVYIVISIVLVTLVAACVFVLRAETRKWFKDHFTKTDKHRLPAKPRPPRTPTDLEQQVYLPAYKSTSRQSKHLS